MLTNNINQLGGIERVISLLCQGFKEDDSIDLTILSLYSKPGTPGFFKLPNKVKCVHAGFSVNARPIRFLIDFLKKNNTDVLITFHPDIALMVAGIKPFFRSINWIATEHSQPSQYTWKRSLLNLLAFRKADRFVVLTEDAKDFYLKRHIQNTMVIPNPVSFTCDRLSNYSTNILAVGRIETIKRFDLLIKAFGSIEKKYPDWKLRIAGSGTQFDELMKEAKQYDNVELLGSRRDVKDLMLKSSFLVISSQSESFCLSAIEALECGLPIVSTELTSIRSITTGYNVAVFAYQNDWKDLADKIEGLINNPSLVRKMGVEAKECAKQYHIENIMRYWMKII